MSPASEAPYRFVPTADRLDDLFRRYEQARRLGGIATTLQRVSPRQRVDAIVTILGLNASGGWQRREQESAEQLWLRYLTPVLAETRESAAALAEAAGTGLPGEFHPVIRLGGAGEPGQAPRPMPFQIQPIPVPLWRRAIALAQDLLTARNALAGLVLLALAGGGWWLSRTGTPGADGAGTAAAVVPATQPPRPDAGTSAPPAQYADDAFGNAYRAALSVTLMAVEQLGGDATPRALAEIYAGESDTVDEPALFLAAMLRRWPLPPDAPLPHDDTGAYGLTQYAMAFASVERNAPLMAAQPDLDRGTPDDARLQQDVRDFASGAAVGAVPAATVPMWPSWLPWLAFLPLPLALAWAAATLVPAVRAALTNPAPGARGTPVDIPADGLVVSALPPARRLARQIAWREPGVARRIHAERSVRATIRRAGFLTLVPRRQPRLADYLFLVPRLQRDDHERDRVSRFIDALRRGGLALDVYDYDPDPRTLYPRTASGDDGRQRGDTVLDLRGLRERHPEARLVLVTDGAELVDYFTQAPLPFVAEELAAWPARMLLTPVPLGEWGERELNLSEALGALIGRATPDGFRDLVAAFGERTLPPPRAIAVSRAEEAGDDGLLARLVSWLGAAESRLAGRETIARRPKMLRLNDPVLVSDAEPPPEVQGLLIDDLRGWLGPRGFHWLAACAAYPELRFAITVYLGLKITLERGPVAVTLYDEKLLAQLTLLPWYRIGRMPPWLRRALFAALPAPARERVRTAVDAMLNGSAALPEGTPAGDVRLPIWRPDSRGLDIPPDAVMADLMLKDMSEIVPVLRGGAFARIFRDEVTRAVRRRAWIVAATALWCTGAWLFWPASSGAPHPAGAWLPLAAFAGTTLFLLALLVAVAFWIDRPASPSEAAA